MNRLCLGLVALLGAALVAGCSDDDDDDDSGNGGLPTLDGPQEGTIIITLATNTVTVTQQPQGTSEELGRDHRFPSYQPHARIRTSCVYATRRGCDTFDEFADDAWPGPCFVPHP